MCIKFPDKPKSFKELRIKDGLDILITLIMTGFISFGIAFVGLLLGHNIIFNPKVYLPSHPTKQESRQVKQIKLLINKLRAEQYNKKNLHEFK